VYRADRSVWSWTVQISASGALLRRVYIHIYIWLLRSPSYQSLTGKYSFFGSGCAYLLVLNVGIFWIDRVCQGRRSATACIYIADSNFNLITGGD